MDTTKQYLRSPIEDDLNTNRQALQDLLMPSDKKYISENWKAREYRLIDCYTKHYSNLGHSTAQMGESFNRVIHTFTDHQMSLRTAAQGFIDYVDDFYRDFERGLVSAQVDNLPGLPKANFQWLRPSITLQALELLRTQWRILSRHQGYLDKPCTGSFRKQYLLPCAHDL